MKLVKEFWWKPMEFFHSAFVKYFILGFGLVSLALAVFCSFFWNEFLASAVQNELVLTNSSKSFNLWARNPIPMHIDFYFFNWTNPSDLKRPRYKPRFQEVGPFRFREEIRKTEIQWNANDTVTYKKVRTWHFEGGLGETSQSLDDAITTLNVIALTAARSTRHWSKLIRLPLSAALSSTQATTLRKTVGEFLFDGFSDPLIDLASKMPGLSHQVPFDKFAWFYKRNGSFEFDGVFNVGTGKKDLKNFGKIHSWNFENRTPFYEETCGEVKGSAGDFWPPPQGNPSKITLFSPDMCRYVDFAFAKEEAVGNVKGFKYESGKGLMDNGTMDPNNKCFCGGRCLPSGAVNVSSCRFGAPAFVSYPHFHLADPFYLGLVEGLRPQPQLHDTYIILEKVWGIPLEIAVRLQINLLLESDPGIRMFDGVPSILFPMMWFEQKVTMPEQMLKEIKLLLALPALGSIACVVFYVVGFSCLAFFAVTVYVKTKTRFSFEEANNTQ